MNPHQKKRLAMASRLATESGRCLEDWLELASQHEAEGFMALVAWLKTEHGLGHFQARLVAEVHRDGGL